METLSPERIKHTFIETALKEAVNLKQEKQLLQERLDKLEETREQVTASVYQKVRQDYLERLNQLGKKLLDLQKELETDRQAILEKKKTVQAQLVHHREVLEEAKLRASLGEYTDEQYKKVESAVTSEIQILEDAQKSLETELEKYQKTFTEPAPVTASPPPTPVVPEVKKTLPIEPGTDRILEPSVAPISNPPVKQETKKPSASVAVADEPTLPRINNPLTRPATEESLTQQDSAPPDRVPIIIHLENEKVIEKVPVDKTLVIGRSPASNIVLNEPKVSRRHAEIHTIAGKYIIVDLDSSNGTFVAGKKIKECVLRPDDQIKIGNATLIFQS